MQDSSFSLPGFSSVLNFGESVLGPRLANRIRNLTGYGYWGILLKKVAI